MSHIKTEDVTQSLRFFIGLMISFDVDDDGFVIKKSNGERLLYGSSDQPKKEMVLYQENIPRGFHVINPYAEGLGENTPPQVFFYKFLRLGMIARIRILMLAACKLALESKGVKDIPEYIGIPDDIPSSGPMMTILSGNVGPKKSLIDAIDIKTIEEIDKYTQTPSVRDTMVDPVYRRTIPGTVVEVKAISSEAFLTSTPGLRKETAKVIRHLIANILGVKEAADLAQFSTKALAGAPVKMSSWLEAIYLIYERINAALADVFPEHLVDMGEFRTHLNNLADYANNSKFTAIINSPTTPTTTAAPVQVTPSLGGGSVPGMAVPSTRPDLQIARIPSASSGVVDVPLQPAPAFYQGQAYPPQQPYPPQAYGQMPVQQPMPGVPVMGQAPAYGAGGVPTAGYVQQPGMPQPGYGAPSPYGVQQPQYYGGVSPMQQPQYNGPVPVQTTVFNPLTGQQMPAIMPSYGNNGGTVPGMPYGIR